MKALSRSVAGALTLACFTILKGCRLKYCHLTDLILFWIGSGVSRSRIAKKSVVM